MKPRIGVFPQYDRERRRWFIVEAYIRSIQEAGGEPYLVFSSEPEVLLRGDGYIFPGGPDVNPVYYGQDAMQGCGDICTARDTLELTALRELRELRKPVLGICRGLQMINVAFGGSLHQDMKSITSLQHYQVAGDEVLTHAVHITEGSVLREVLGTESLCTNSFHHQCIATLGEGLQVSGRSRDDVIEAAELRGHPYFLGVQWHPEHLTREHEEARRLFAALVAHC